MQIALANQDYRPKFVIEEFESFIWKDVHAGYGEFELVLKENYLLTGGNLKNYQFLRFSESNRVMMIETVDIPRQEEDNDGTGVGNRIIVKGRSIEAFLLFRTNTNGVPSPESDIRLVDQQISQMAERIMDRYIINPDNPENKIPGLEMGFIVQGRPIVSRILPRDLIYNVVHKVCTDAEYGWRIYSIGDGKLAFGVFRGIDHTNRYDIHYLEFSEETETMTNMAQIQSIANWRNHARVEGARTTHNVYQGLPDTIPPHAGFNRRTLVVPASDVGTDPDTNPADDIPILEARGVAALKEEANKYISATDGEVPYLKWNEMSYGLGDLVRVKDFYGDKQKMRIVEDTWTINESGDVKRTPSFRAVLENANP